MSAESRRIAEQIRREYATHFSTSSTTLEYIPGGSSLPPDYADLHLDAEARRREIVRLREAGMIDDANALRDVRDLAREMIHGRYTDPRPESLRQPNIQPALRRFTEGLSFSQNELRGVLPPPEAYHTFPGLGFTPVYGLAQGTAEPSPSPVVPSKDDVLPWITKMLEVSPEGLKQLQAELAEFVESYDI